MHKSWTNVKMQVNAASDIYRWVWFPLHCYPPRCKTVMENNHLFVLAWQQWWIIVICHVSISRLDHFSHPQKCIAVSWRLIVVQKEISKYHFKPLPNQQISQVRWFTCSWPHIEGGGVSIRKTWLQGNDGPHVKVHPQFCHGEVLCQYHILHIHIDVRYHAIFKIC